MADGVFYCRRRATEPVSYCRVQYPIRYRGTGLVYVECAQIKASWQFVCTDHYRDLVQSAPQLAAMVKSAAGEERNGPEHTAAIRAAISHCEVRERLKFEGKLPV